MIKAEIIYSFVYASRADSYGRFYDCTDAECHLSVVYQFHCAQCGFNSKFVFLDNYIYMFKQGLCTGTFNTFKLMLVIPALTIFLSLVFAFILYTGRTWRNLLSYGILFPRLSL